MPELPEVQAHAERLTAQFAGSVLERFVPLTFTVLKTALPRPEQAYGQALQAVGRWGKYLLLGFGEITFAVHLMQGGRLVVDTKQSPKPRNGQARFVFTDGPALLLTEAGTERRAGVWCVARICPEHRRPGDFRQSEVAETAMITAFPPLFLSRASGQAIGMRTIRPPFGACHECFVCRS